jgi:hypothetical protein
MKSNDAREDDARGAQHAPRERVRFGPDVEQHRAEHDKDEADPQLRLACPKCGAGGAASLKSLNHFFYCRRCDQWYRMVGTSFVAVQRPAEVVDFQVRMGFTDWNDGRFREQLPLTTARGFAQWLFRFKYRLAVVGVVLVGMIFVAVARFQPAKAEKVAELPRALEDRVPLWIHGWIAGDVPQLMQLSARSHDRQLRQWVSHNRPPSDCDRGELLKSEISLKSIKPRGKQSAVVTAEVRALDRKGQAKKFLVAQTWLCSDGTWYFMPPLAGRTRR